MIDVRQVGQSDPMEFTVVIGDDHRATRHQVTMSRDAYEKLAGSTVTPENCLYAVFRFLLDREPREAVLARFDCDDVARYFPEFDKVMPSYLGSVSEGSG